MKANAKNNRRRAQESETIEERREKLLAEALSKPGVAEATRVFEAILKQSPNDGQLYGSPTHYSAGANA